jgi:acyl-lipid omega-6 desaturase (Delta-12 desaturase)
LTDEQRSNPPVNTQSATDWKAIVARFQRSSGWQASWQLVNTFVPYALLWYAMVRCAAISWWLVLPLAVLAAGFLVRIFIFFHDCGHGSFFQSVRANRITGFVCGMLTFTPFRHWTWAHATHHGASGDLDRRGTGDIWTLTVDEYLKASRWQRLAYRLSRNPLILFVLSPLYVFVIHQRFPVAGARRRERRSVQWMNLALLAMATTMSLAIGFKQYLLIQLTLTTISGTAGIWLFYVQHQFESTYWERTSHWSYAAAALQGSSYYKLPRILQWFSGNIGLHHIHHLSPAIPNYRLQHCLESEPLFQQVRPLTLMASFRALPRVLWDEQRKRLISFRQIRSLQPQGAPVATARTRSSLPAS